jgi:hypothetical protein
VKIHPSWLTGIEIRGKISTEHEGMNAGGQKDRSARPTFSGLPAFPRLDRPTDARLFRRYFPESPASDRK